jgi:hypothetical protein
MFTILGAGGPIGNELVKELTPRGKIPGALPKALRRGRVDHDVVGRRVGDPNQRRLGSRNQFPTSLTGVHDS